MTTTDQLVFTERVTYIGTACPVDYQCPVWCERPDHSADLVGPGDEPLHYGPTFGLIMTGACGDHAPTASYDEPVDEDLTVADLREHAADALAAAEWLEAHQ